MNVPGSTCSRATIEQFLADQLSSQELSAFEDHLESCLSCRENLDNLAAERSWWDEARLYLSAAGQSNDDGAPGKSEDETAQTLFGLKSYLAPTDDPRMLGRLGPYEIVGIIGCGGMGIVLKGFDGPLNRYVAIKVLGPHLAMNPLSRQRFAREAKAAATVVNLNVIAIHSVSEANGLPYFVMLYVRGPSLEKRLRDAGTFSVVEILRVGMQIASGLAAAHAQGVVHRDIKPANIMLEEGIERVTITDFGLARVADDASMTQSGVVAGTPQYMSPEQARGDAVDPRSDLFSLGSVLYALCTGQPPFQATGTMGVLKRVEECRPRPIRAINPEIPALLARIIERLHAKNPAERFQSAAEVAVLLEGYLAHLGQPEMVPAPEMAAVAKKTGRNLVRRLISLTPSLLVLIALGFGGGAWLAGCGGPPAAKKETFKEISERLSPVLIQDFRKLPDALGLSRFGANIVGLSASPYGQGAYLATVALVHGKNISRLQPLPDGLVYRNVEIAKHVQILSEGLQIKVQKPYTVRSGKGLGVQTTFGLRGDFDITATFENFQGDTPVKIEGWGNGVGFSLTIQPTEGPILSIARTVRFDSEGITWDKFGANRQSFLPSKDTVGRFRFLRTGPTLYCLWAPGTQGDDFQILEQSEIGTNDIKTAWLNVFTGNQRMNVEARVLEWQIRGQKETNPVHDASKAPGSLKIPAINTAKGALAGALLLGMVITLSLALGAWLFIRRCRCNDLSAVADDPTQNLPFHSSMGGEMRKDGVKKKWLQPSVLVYLKRPVFLAFLILVILGIASACWFISSGCATTSENEDSKPAFVELPTAFYHDFRRPLENNVENKLLPPELELFQVTDKKTLHMEPEGLRISIKRAPSWGVGVKTTFGLKGDFEVTTGFEILKWGPPIDNRLGVSLGVSPVQGGSNAYTAMDRFVSTDGTQGVRWYSKKLKVDRQVPYTGNFCRLRLTRKATTLQYSWSPKTQGEDFKEIGQSEWPYDVDHVRLVLFNSQSHSELDVRFLDLRIRVGKEKSTGFDPSQEKVFNPAKGWLAKGLLIGMVITLLLALCVWLFVRRRRRRELTADTLDKPKLS